MFGGFFAAPCRSPTWPSRSRSRPRPTPPGSRRWTRTGSWSRPPARASASASMATPGRSSGGRTSAWSCRPSNRARTPGSCSTGSSTRRAWPTGRNSGGSGRWAGSARAGNSRRSSKPGGRRRIRFLGVVSDAQLCKLYRTAAYSAYPSLYEGFGFPVLDSLRHHTPVLAAQNSSIREFDSPGLFFFDPADAATLDDAYDRLQAEAIGRDDPASAARRRLFVAQRRPDAAG